MSRIIRMLVATTAAIGLGAFGLITAGAASAGTTVGTTGSGSWFFDQGDGSNAIATTQGSPTTAYQAQVQQPINPNGTSVWSAKRGVIPVQFYLQQRTCTTQSTTYPSDLLSQQGVSSGVGSYGNLSWTPPSGSSLTVGQVSNLTAHFTWQYGTDHTGSMYWIINTPDGNVWIYYGDLSSSFQSGQGGTGVNMITTGEPRVEISQLNPAHTPRYDTLSSALADTATSGIKVADEPVNWIGLAVDEGSAGTQDVQLQDVNIDGNTYTPGTVSGAPVCGSWANTTSPAMFIDIAQGSSSDPGTVDEATYTGVGDTSGQFAVVGGMYKYNLSNSMSAGTYNVFMTPGTDAQRIPVTNSPTGAATFVLK